ncbi:hypothetical protein ACPF4F_003127, partial [Vibrio cholerae]
MNILYYLEPQVELGDKYFRYGTLKSIIIPETRSLKQNCCDWDIKIILSSCLVEKMKLEGVDYSHLDIIQLNEKEVNHIFGDDSYF